jgi:hypothetical protein
LAATGGTKPYTWKVIAGMLPLGLTLNPSTGEISGIPMNPVERGILTIQVTDADDPPNVATASLIVSITHQDNDLQRFP